MTKNERIAQLEANDGILIARFRMLEDKVRGFECRIAVLEKLLAEFERLNGENAARVQMRVSALEEAGREQRELTEHLFEQGHEMDIKQFDRLDALELDVIRIQNMLKY